MCDSDTVGVAVWLGLFFAGIEYLPVGTVH